jgi:hypothetical protein
MTQGTNLKYNSPKFLDDYVGVDELIEQMNEKYPTGHLITEVLDMSDTHVVFKASFFTNEDDKFTKCTGHSRVEKSNMNQHWFEKAETKARGRCLRVLLSAGVTKEEMEDVDSVIPNAASKPKQSVVKADVQKSHAHVVNERTNSAIAALQKIQQTVKGKDLLQLLNTSLEECELVLVKTLDEAKEHLYKLGEADVAELTDTLNRKADILN